MFLFLSAQSLCLPLCPLYTSHTANHSGGICLFFLLFIASCSHEKTCPFIPTPWLGSQLKAQTVSDSSVSHHQHLPTVWRQNVGSTILTLNVSHSGEMRHNKPFHRILIPDRIAFWLPCSLQTCLSCRAGRQQPATFASLWPLVFF